MKAHKVLLHKVKNYTIFSHLKVITSTQTSPGYTNLNLPLRSRPPKIEINTLKKENNESSQGFTSQGEELHNFLTAQNSRCSQ